MSVRQDIQLLKAIYDCLTLEEQVKVMSVISQMGVVTELIDRYDGAQGAILGLMMGAKMRPEKTKAEFAEIFGIAIEEPTPQLSLLPSGGGK